MRPSGSNLMVSHLIGRQMRTATNSTTNGLKATAHIHGSMQGV